MLDGLRQIGSRADHWLLRGLPEYALFPTEDDRIETIKNQNSRMQAHFGCNRWHRMGVLTGDALIPFLVE